MEPELSVLIVCFNDADEVLPCLASIYATPPDAAFEVVLVDNASSDGSAGRVRQDYPQVRVIEAGYNAGYAGGNNLAFEHARGKYVLFLNPDTRLSPGTLDVLLKTADELPELGALGPKVLNEDGSLQHSCFHSPRLADVLDSVMATRIPGYARLFGYMGYSDGDYEREMEVNGVSGCCLLAPRELLATVGVFDEEYFIYFEEADLCERIRRHGRRVYYTPETAIVHLGGATTSRQETWFRIQAERSRRRFFEKHRGPLSRSMLGPLLVVSSFLRLISAGAATILTAGLSPRVRRKPVTELKVLGWQLGFLDQGPRPS